MIEFDYWDVYFNSPNDFSSLQKDKRTKRPYVTINLATLYLNYMYLADYKFVDSLFSPIFLQFPKSYFTPALIAS